MIADNVITVDKQMIPFHRKPYPSDVLKWMKANASPKMSLKLMQVCKYFQHREFPYFVVKNFQYEFDRWGYDRFYKREHGIGFDILPNNLWITQNLHIGYRTWLLRFLLPKIAFCDIEVLHLLEQFVSLTEFKVLCNAKKINNFEIKRTKIFGDDGKNIVSMNTIFEHLPKVEYITIEYDHPSFDSEENHVPAKLKIMKFWKISKSYDMKNFINFMDVS